MSDPTRDSGEKQGRRETIDRMTSDLVGAGNSPEYAREKAHEAAIRADRREAGERNPKRRDRREEPS